MLYASKTRRRGLLLLLANALIVCSAAVIQHAIANEDERAPSGTASDTVEDTFKDTFKDTVEDTVESANANMLSESTGGEPINDEVAVVPPQVDDSTPSRLQGDPVLDELRKLIRDPESGLDVPPIQIAPLSNPKAFRGGEPAPPSSREQWLRLKQRTESMHQLARAAVTLSHEAQALTDAGQTAEAELIMGQVAQLHAMLARLAITH